MGERITTFGAGRYASRVIGPTSAEPGVSASVLPAALRQNLLRLFRTHLARPASNPLQMMLEAAEFDPVLVHFRWLGDAGGAGANGNPVGPAAVAHFLRANFAGDRPALAGICLLLSGRDEQADERAVTLVEQSKDSAGRPLPVRPAVLRKVLDADRPLGALLFFTEQTLKDPSLRIVAGCLADAYFDVIGVPGGDTGKA
jgi:hypothetical protein